MTNDGDAGATLLDTCATIWLANGIGLASAVIDRIDDAARRGTLFVSPVSAWEIGLLAHPAGNRRPIAFDPDPKTWFLNLTQRFAVEEAIFSAEIALDSSALPGDLHRDPADRLIVATARALNATLITRDRRILDYAKQGHVHAMAC